MIKHIVEIQCDECQTHFSYESESVSYTETKAQESGWSVTSQDGWEYKHYCPNCKEKQHEKTN